MANERETHLRHLACAVEERKYLYKISDVIGMAVGHREREGKITHDHALIVYVKPGRKGHDKSDYPKHQRIPERVWVERRGKRVWLPVDIVESEIGRLQATLRCGPSVGNRDAAVVTGTLGWIGRRASDGTPVLCTNYHVLLPMVSQSTDPILVFPHQSLGDVTAVSPSIAGGGDPNVNVVGRVVRGRRDQSVDAAIVAISADLTAEPSVVGIGAYGAARFIAPADLAAGIDVQMRGSVSTTPKQGRVIQYPAEFPFGYPDRAQPLLMTDLIVTDIQTLDGDSGSVLLDSNRQPLGILLGIGSGRSYFLHIRNIMSRMQVRDF